MNMHQVLSNWLLDDRKKNYTCSMNLQICLFWEKIDHTLLYDSPFILICKNNLGNISEQQFCGVLEFVDENFQNFQILSQLSS